MTSSSFYHHRPTGAAVSVEEISPLPKVPAEVKEKKRKSRTCHAADLTSTPYKSQLQSTPLNVKRASIRRKLATEVQTEGNSKPKEKSTKLRKKKKTSNMLTSANGMKSCQNKGQAVLSVGMWVFTR